MQNMRTKIVADKVIVIAADGILVSSGNQALDLFMELSYTTGITRFCLEASALHPDFFVLSSGLAGEILQKCSNYHWKLAILGDFSTVPASPLQDFIRESNKGQCIFFLPDEGAAVDRLLSV